MSALCDRHVAIGKAVSYTDHRGKNLHYLRGNAYIQFHHHRNASQLHVFFSYVLKLNCYKELIGLASACTLEYDIEWFSRLLPNLAYKSKKMAKKRRKEIPISQIDYGHIYWFQIDAR